MSRIGKRELVIPTGVTVTVENNTVTYRQYGKSDEITVPFNEFLKLLKKQIQNKK